MGLELASRLGLEGPGAGRPLSPESEWERPRSTRLSWVLCGRHLPPPLLDPRVDPDTHIHVHRHAVTGPEASRLLRGGR